MSQGLKMKLMVPHKQHFHSHPPKRGSITKEERDKGGQRAAAASCQYARVIILLCQESPSHERTFRLSFTRQRRSSPPLSAKTSRQL